MKSSIVLCYNMNKLIYLLTYVLVCLLVMSVSRAKTGAQIVWVVVVGRKRTIYWVAARIPNEKGHL